MNEQLAEIETSRNQVYTETPSEIEQEPEDPHLPKVVRPGALACFTFDQTQVHTLQS